jgi:hypothetical protein
MLRISVLTSYETESWAVGRRIISAFADINPKLVPESLFQWESKISDYESVAMCEKYWAQKSVMQVQGSSLEFSVGLRWKRKKAAKYDAEISHTYRNIKGEQINGSLIIQAQFNIKVEWLNVFREACLAMSADYALMHIFTGVETANVTSGSPESFFNSGVLHKGKVPNIGWAAFYGGELSKLIDTEQLIAAGFLVEKIGGGYLVRVTENIQDIIENFSFFSKRRAEMKKIFPEGFFLIQQEPAS